MHVVILLKMDYKATFKTASVQLDALQADYTAKEQKLLETGQEISHVADVLTALAPLAGEVLSINEEVTEIMQSVKQVEVLEVGITEKIRQVLQAKAAQAFYPVGVRTELEAVKYDLTKHPNVMATIHGVLKRLVAQQQVVAAAQAGAGGKIAYQWNPAAKK
jgi:superfamily II helicase